MKNNIRNKSRKELKETVRNTRIGSPASIEASKVLDGRNQTIRFWAAIIVAIVSVIVAVSVALLPD